MNERRGNRREILSRLIRIHEALHAHTYPSKRALAERLGVSEKTVERDIKDLQINYQAPIEYNPSYRGYHYTEAFETPLLAMLSDRELLALCLAGEIFHSDGIGSLSESIREVIRKTLKHHAGKLSINEDRIREHFSRNHTGIRALDESSFNLIIDALLDEVPLQCYYKKPSDTEPEKRIIHPYHLSNYEGDWYLMAYCETRQSIRNFNLLRMMNPRLLKKRSFHQSPEFELQAQLKGSMGRYIGDQEYHVTIAFDAFATPYIREKTWHPSQRLDTDPRTGALHLHLTLNHLIDIKRWVLSWGEHATILAPPELVQDMQETLAALRESYG